MRAKKKKKIFYSVIVALILLILVFLAWPAKKIYPDNASVKYRPAASQAAPTANTTTPSNQPTYPADQAASLWAVVNKGRILPAGYVPSSLVLPNVTLRLSSINSEMHVRADTAAAMEKMFAAAKNDGISLRLESGYRSYAEQSSVYSGYVAA